MHLQLLIDRSIGTVSGQPQDLVDDHRLLAIAISRPTRRIAPLASGPGGSILGRLQPADHRAGEVTHTRLRLQVIGCPVQLTTLDEGIGASPKRPETAPPLRGDSPRSARCPSSRSSAKWTAAVAAECPPPIKSTRRPAKRARAAPEYRAPDARCARQRALADRGNAAGPDRIGTKRAATVQHNVSVFDMLTDDRCRRMRSSLAVASKI